MDLQDCSVSKCTVIKADDRSSIPETTWWKERTNSYLHWAPWYAHANTQDYPNPRPKKVNLPT